MKAIAKGLPRSTAVLLFLELVDRGLSVSLLPEKEGGAYEVAAIDLEPRPDPKPVMKADYNPDLLMQWAESIRGNEPWRAEEMEAYAMQWKREQSQ